MPAYHILAELGIRIGHPRVPSILVHYAGHFIMYLLSSTAFKTINRHGYGIILIGYVYRLWARPIGAIGFFLWHTEIQFTTAGSITTPESCKSSRRAMESTKLS